MEQLGPGISRFNPPVLGNTAWCLSERQCNIWLCACFANPSWLPGPLLPGRFTALLSLVIAFAFITGVFVWSGRGGGGQGLFLSEGGLLLTWLYKWMVTIGYAGASSLLWSWCIHVFVSISQRRASPNTDTHPSWPARRTYLIRIFHLTSSPLTRPLLQPSSPSSDVVPVCNCVCVLLWEVWVVWNWAVTWTLMIIFFCESSSLICQPHVSPLAPQLMKLPGSTYDRCVEFFEALEM